jgi:hypothetical protein
MWMEGLARWDKATKGLHRRSGIGDVSWPNITDVNSPIEGIPDRRGRFPEGISVGEIFPDREIEELQVLRAEEGDRSYERTCPGGCACVKWYQSIEKLLCFL